MDEYTQEQIDAAMKRISEMDHITMCRIWRFGEMAGADELYFRGDLPTGVAFTDRLFKHFGGFTPEISKQLGWEM